MFGKFLNMPNQTLLLLAHYQSTIYFTCSCLLLGRFYFLQKWLDCIGFKKSKPLSCAAYVCVSARCKWAVLEPRAKILLNQYQKFRTILPSCTRWFYVYKFDSLKMQCETKSNLVVKQVYMLLQYLKIFEVSCIKSSFSWNFAYTWPQLQSGHQWWRIVVQHWTKSITFFDTS